MKRTTYILAAISLLAVVFSCSKKTEPYVPVLNPDGKEVTGITLDKTSIKFTEKKETAILTATIAPADAADTRILWKSSDENVAKVSNGVVEAVDYGTAVITASTYAGGFSASCAVDFSEATVDSRAIDILGTSSPIYWSSVNYGAEKPGEFGAYLSWGEIIPKSSYTWDTYMVPFVSWCGTDEDPLANSASISGLEDYDVVAARWGDGWRMPTDAEIATLVSKTVWTWKASEEGTYGYEVKNPSNGKSIFIPVAGYYDGEVLAHAGAKGRYWTANPAAEKAYAAMSIDFSSDAIDFDEHSRYLGFAIRPVKDK